MPQHDYLSKLPLNLPETLPKNDAEWRVFRESLRRYFNAMSNISLKSGGITNPDNPSGVGYWVGWDNANKIAAMFGDFDNDNFIRFSQALSAFFIGSKTTVKQGDDVVFLAFGIQAGSARDGDTVTFSPPFPSDIIPKVIFSRGGITFDTSIGTADSQAVEVQAQNLTNTGFTMSAKIYAIGSTTTTTLTLPGTLVESSEVEKTGTPEAFDDNYTFNFDVRVPGETDSGFAVPVTVEVGLYAKPSGGSYTKYKTITLTNNSGSTRTDTLSKTITVDGLAASSFFKVQIDSDSSTLDAAAITGTSVTYETASFTKNSATPTGSPAIPWLAIGTRAS